MESRSGHGMSPRAKLRDTSVKRRVLGCRDEADDESEAQGRSSKMAEQASACEFTVDQGESCELEATQVPGKRVLLLINSTMSTASMAKLTSQDVSVRCPQKLGTSFCSLTALQTAKNLIRSGVVVWIHIVVRPIHCSKPTWLTQLCRTAHRAGAQWSMECFCNPSEVKPLDALMRHKYVRVEASARANIVSMVSEAVSLGELDE